MVKISLCVEHCSYIPMHGIFLKIIIPFYVDWGYFQEGKILVFEKFTFLTLS